MSMRHTFLMLAVIGLLFAAGSAGAADFDTNLQNGADYATDGNWSGGSVPNGVNAAIGVSGSSYNDATLATSVSNPNDLYVGYNAAGSFTLNSGANFTVGSHLYVGYSASGAGALNVNDGAVLTVTNDRILIGLYGTGIYNQTGGLVTSWQFCVGAGAYGVGTATISGGTLNTTNDCKIGWNALVGVSVPPGGAGTFNLLGNAVVTSNEVSIGGDQKFNAGVVSISGNASWTDGGSFYIGRGNGGSDYDHTSGSVSQTGGTLTVSGQIGMGDQACQAYYDISSGVLNANGGLTLGSASGAPGSDGYGSLNGFEEVTLSGAGKILTTNLTIGANSYNQATFTQTGGVLAVSGNLYVNAGDSTTTGLFNYTGGIATVAGATFIGNGGTINFGNSGGTLTTGALYYSTLDPLTGNGTVIAHGQVADGDLTLDSLTKTFYNGGVTVNLDMTNPAVNGDLGAGYQSVGTLEVQTSVTSANGILGYGSGSSGSATVSNGATWTMTGNLYAGYNGNGALAIDGGTVAAAGNVMIANGGPIYDNNWNVIGVSNGQVTVNGGLLQANNMYVGQGDNSVGTLAVQDGGVATIAGSVYIANGYSSNGQVTIGSGGLLQVTGASSSVNIGCGYNSVGTLAVQDGGIATIAGGMYVGNNGGAGTLNISNDGAVTVAGATYLNFNGASSTINFNGGTLTTGALYYSTLDPLTGNGTVIAHGQVADGDLTLDSPTKTFYNGGVTINLDMTNPAVNGDLGAGYQSAGTLEILTSVTFRQRIRRLQLQLVDDGHDNGFQRCDVESERQPLLRLRRRQHRSGHR